MLAYKGGKPEYPEKNLSELGENQQQTHWQPTTDSGRPVLESNLGHIKGAVSPIFSNTFDFVSLVVCNQFMHEKGPSI